jgi:hypothetical protein
MSKTLSRKRKFYPEKCKLEYKNDVRMLLNAMNTISYHELMQARNEANAINSVIILKDCLILYNKCLTSYNEENLSEYNKNVNELEIKLKQINSENFIKYSEFRRKILSRKYPNFDEDKLIDKLQVLQTGDIISFYKLPKGFLELLQQCKSKKTSNKESKSHHLYGTGKKKKIKTNKKKFNFKKLKKQITRRLKPRFKTRSKPKKK